MTPYLEVRNLPGRSRTWLVVLCGALLVAAAIAAALGHVGVAIAFVVALVLAVPRSWLPGNGPGWGRAGPYT